jgi:hypothetical protein
MMDQEIQEPANADPNLRHRQTNPDGVDTHTIPSIPHHKVMSSHHDDSTFEMSYIDGLWFCY